MAGSHERESPRELASKKQGGVHKEMAANTPLASLFDQEVFYKLSYTPVGEDPVFWPIYILNEINYLIVNREYIKNNPGCHLNAAVGEIAALVEVEEAIRKVTTAYKIIAHPHCKEWVRRECIEVELETDRQSLGRDQVELNNTELGMLSKIIAGRGLPFNPEKRIYSYSEVSLSPSVDP